MFFISNKSPNYKEFICDKRKDVQDLPKDSSIEKGSTAFVIEDASAWILNSNREWSEI